MPDPREIILEHSGRGCELREAFFQANADRLADLSRTAAVTMAKGGKLLFCGNGGSAADSQHLAAEFVNRFMMERPPLPAIALTTDTSILTAIGNDYSYGQVFEKQVLALGQAGDMLFGLSTSGGSENVLAAMRAAQKKGLAVIGFCGADGEKMRQYSRQVFNVPEKNTALIQEIHITMGHLLCRLTDYYLFEAVSEIQPFLNDGAHSPDNP